MMRRRTFVKSVGAAGLGLGLSGMRLGGLVRGQSANEKLDIAVVGTANQARFSIENLTGENLVAFADVDGGFLKKAGADFPKARLFGDYREMLEKAGGDFDAVVAAVPDHHHAQVTLRALGLGKHVYCEKPMGHTVHEVRLMREAARRAGVATQMGIQIHATDHYRRMVETVRSGVIGRVSEVHIWQDGFNVGSRIPDRVDEVPADLDWEMWLGPAKWRAYHEKIYHPFTWRGWWDFGGGILSDIACHVFDLAHWSLGLDVPVAVTASGTDPLPERPARSMIAEYEYGASNAANGGGGVKVTWYHGAAHVDVVNVREKFGVPGGWRAGRNILFVGEKGMLLTDYDKHMVLPEGRFAEGEEKKKWGEIAGSPGHHREWMAAAKGGPAALCNFDYAGNLTEAVLLGLVSHRAGNVRIEYDAATGRVTNNDAANAWLTKGYRAGWDVGALV